MQSLSKDVLFGMNILTLAGFVLMGITVTLARSGQTGKAFERRADGWDELYAFTSGGVIVPSRTGATELCDW